MIEAVIVSQGDELTTGQITDTNSGWIAGQLWERGIRTRQVLTIPDHRDDLIDGLQHAARRAPIVICTGGLGPTSDDLTAEAVAEAFGQPLALRPDALAQIEARFAAWSREMSPANRKQAFLPAGSRLLENRRGTAPGFAAPTPTGGVLYCLPGVPHEMRAMIAQHVLPDIVARHALTPSVCRQIGVVMSESRLGDALSTLDLSGATLGFRAAPFGNLVKLRFPPDTAPHIADEAARAVRQRLGDAAFSMGEPDLAVVLGDLLRAREETLAVAESCTGGQLTGRLVSVPGCSAYLKEGVVAYSNASKQRLCGVPAAMIDAYGAASQQVATAMATGLRARAGTDWAIGVSGVAGPGRGHKPPGTVHIAIVGPDGPARHLHTRLPGDRNLYIARAATMALLLLYQSLQDASHNGQNGTGAV